MAPSKRPPWTALQRFRSPEWSSALEDVYLAGAETARLNPELVAEELWRELGPADDPTSWELEGDVVAAVLDLETAKAAFLLGVAAVRATGSGPSFTSSVGSVEAPRRFGARRKRRVGVRG